MSPAGALSTNETEHDSTASPGWMIPPTDIGWACPAQPAADQIAFAIFLAMPFLRSPRVLPNPFAIHTAYLFVMQRPALRVARTESPFAVGPHRSPATRAAQTPCVSLPGTRGLASALGGTLANAVLGGRHCPAHSAGLSRSSLVAAFGVYPCGHRSPWQIEPLPDLENLASLTPQGECPLTQSAVTTHASHVITSLSPPQRPPQPPQSRRVANRRPGSYVGATPAKPPPTLAPGPPRAPFSVRHK
jgi:hypothetical protein